MAILNIWMALIKYAFFLFLLATLYIEFEDMKDMVIVAMDDWQQKKYISLIVEVLFYGVLVVIAILLNCVFAVFWPIFMWILAWRVISTRRGRRAKKQRLQVHL